MPNPYPHASIRGERTMAQGFVAQYAAEAAMQAEGVAGLDTSSVISLKEVFGVEHEGKGVKVVFHEGNDEAVAIAVYPVVFFGTLIPEVAWQIQERVKADDE